MLVKIFILSEKKKKKFQPYLFHVNKSKNSMSWREMHRGFHNVESTESKNAIRRLPFPHIRLIEIREA